MDSLSVTHTMTGNVPAEEMRPDDLPDVEDEQKTKLFNKLRAWLEHERDRQAPNRAEMAIDADFYDGLQWTEEDAREVESRGQAPLVFNETKVSLDWIIGAEKRTRVDWRVLPREESDQQGATIRSKVLKYLSDVNRTPYMRSKAFAEAAICGLSYLEDGLSSEATDDILYSGAESWRNVLHDSYHKLPDGRDMRYLFRWKFLDLDVAQKMWPEFADHLESMAQGADQLAADEDDQLWYLGENIRDPQNNGRSSYTRHLASTGSSVQSDRRRVKVYEAWYKEPIDAKVLMGGPYAGDLYDPNLPAHADSVAAGESDVVDSIILRAHVAYMTDGKLLRFAESPFRHNGFSLTPVYCFRRGRDGMPYGFVRNMRDSQMDLNKRMSKALFVLSVNQLIVDKDTFSDQKDGYTLQDALDNVANPQGYFVKNHRDATLEIRRDYAEFQGQTELLNLDRMFLQAVSGVTADNLGRVTNAVSGRAIEARQDQGSLTTNGIFDNYRLAISVSGSKALSNCEKFYTLPKVIRLTEAAPGEAQPKIDWVRINQPELQPDGSVRFLNDMSASRADFIVDEQDYRATMRQAMFDQLIEMLKIVAPVAPQMAVGLLDLVVDANDFPGKEAFIQRIKMLLAEIRGEAKSPEQKAAEAEALELQKRAAAAKIAKDEADADLKDAQADTSRAMLNANMVAVDLERVPQSEAPMPTAAPAQPGEKQPMAPAAHDSPSGASPSPGSAPSGAASAGTPELIDAMQQFAQQMTQMMARQAAIASQQTAQLRQEMHAALAQRAAPTAKPRKKIIRFMDADGREVTAEVELQ